MNLASPAHYHAAGSVVGWIPRLARRGSRLRQSIRTARLLVRAIPTSRTEPGPRIPQQFTAQLVQRRADSHFEALLELATEQGLDSGWCLEQFEHGAAACVTFHALTQKPAGMGFVTVKPFFVAEVDHDYVPPAGGCYLYATYVSPDFRGHRLQRSLDLARMAHAAQAHGSITAHALVSAHNAASLKGHAAGGFAMVARVSIIDAGPWRLAILRPMGARALVGSFMHHGIPLMAGLNILRLGKN